MSHLEFVIMKTVKKISPFEKIFNLNLKTKFLIPTVIALGVSFFTFTFYLIRDTRTKNEALLAEKSDRITSLLVYSNIKHIWAFDDRALNVNCNSFFKDNEISKIYIEDIDGEVLIDLYREVKGTKDIKKKEDIIQNDEKIATLEVIFTMVLVLLLLFSTCKIVEAFLI